MPITRRLWIKGQWHSRAGYMFKVLTICFFSSSLWPGGRVVGEILVPNPDINCPRSTASATRCNLHFNMHQKIILVWCFFFSSSFQNNEVPIEFCNLELQSFHQHKVFFFSPQWIERGGYWIVILISILLFLCYLISLF